MFLSYASHSILCPFSYLDSIISKKNFFHFFGLLAQKDHLIGLIDCFSFSSSLVSLQFEDINIFPFIVFDLFPLMDSILCSISSLISIISIYFFWGKGVSWPKNHLYFIDSFSYVCLYVESLFYVRNHRNPLPEIILLKLRLVSKYQSYPSSI